MVFFSNNYSVSVLDENWEVIIPILKLKHLPRNGELLYIKKFEDYFTVLNVIHNIEKKHGIFIIVKKYEKKLKN